MKNIFFLITAFILHHNSFCQNTPDTLSSEVLYTITFKKNKDKVRTEIINKFEEYFHDYIFNIADSNTVLAIIVIDNDFEKNKKIGINRAFNFIQIIKSRYPRFKDKMFLITYQMPFYPKGYSVDPNKVIGLICYPKNSHCLDLH